MLLYYYLFLTANAAPSPAKDIRACFIKKVRACYFLICKNNKNKVKERIFLSDSLLYYYLSPPSSEGRNDCGRII